MIRTIAIFFLLAASCAAQTNSFALPPVDNTNRVPFEETLTEQPQEVVSSFRKGFRANLNRAVDQGGITKQEARLLRLASLSSSFRLQAKRLGAIQMAMSGIDLPTDDSGAVDVAAIPWEAATLDQWIAFFRAMLELLREFGILQ